MSSNARTFKRIAEGSSDAPPLAPDALPHWASARDGSSYTAVRLFPRTLNELRKYSREFGRATARDAEWSCVTAWLMSGPPEAALSNPFPVVRTVISTVREYDRFRFEYPWRDGSDPTPPALDRLSADTRQEALRVAAETLSDWRKAGRPYLTPHRIKGAYQNLITRPAFVRKYLSPK